MCTWTWSYSRGRINKDANGTNSSYTVDQEKDTVNWIEFKLTSITSLFQKKRLSLKYLTNFSLSIICIIFNKGPSLSSSNWKISTKGATVQVRPRKRFWNDYLFQRKMYTSKIKGALFNASWVVCTTYHSMDLSYFHISMEMRTNSFVHTHCVFCIVNVCLWSGLFIHFDHLL